MPEVSAAVAPGAPRRRDCLLALGAAGLAAGCAVRAAARTPPAAPAARPGVAHEVAAGVWFVPGTGGEAEPANRGRIGNAGFVVGRDGVVAIDSGTSHRHGLALLEAIAAVTDRPVRALILTHTRQEFVFGASAFAQRGVPVHMHLDAARLMQARCERCLAQLVRALGDDEMQGSAVPAVQVAFERAPTLEAIGRPLRVIGPGGSGPGHVAVLDVATGVLFAGGWLDHQRVPDVQDGDVAAWLQSLDALKRERITAIVPGHGPVAEPTLIETVAGYLRALQARVQALFERGVALSEVPDLARLAAYAGWDQADVIHRRNAALVYLRLERERLLQLPPSS